MTSGEIVLEALKEQLIAGMPDVEILRNTAIPETIGDHGLIIIRDGEIDEPETVLGGFRNVFYSHGINLEIYVQNADQATRDVSYSSLCGLLGDALEGDITLNGTVQSMFYGQPSTAVESVEGGEDIKQGLLTVTVEYAALNPLS